MDYQFDLVGKIGSMALIRREDQEIDYNIISRLGADLKPGMIWVTSGATEIGRLDYIKRTGHELSGDPEQDKTDYSAQGQAILMQNYRQFLRPEYGLRQILVEHTHFNDPEKREHIRQLLIRAAKQKTIPIINYNDPVSDEENRKTFALVLKEVLKLLKHIRPRSLKGYLELGLEDPYTMGQIMSAAAFFWPVSRSFCVSVPLKYASSARFSSR